MSKTNVLAQLPNRLSAATGYSYSLLSEESALGWRTALDTDASAVSAIKSDADWKAADWNAAFSWGNHATEGYLKSVTWTDVSDKPTFATVATSGDYEDLTNKPDFSGFQSQIDTVRVLALAGI